MKRNSEWILATGVFALLLAIFISDLFSASDIPFLLFYMIPIFITSWKLQGKYLLSITLLTSCLIIIGAFFSKNACPASVMLPHRLVEMGILWFSAIILSQRNAAENTYKENNRLLSSILDNTHLCFAYLDKDFNFIRVNRTYAASDNKEPSFYPGKNHFALYPDNENEKIFRRVAETGEAYYAYAKPFTYIDNPERGVTYWDWSLIPVKNASGKVEGLLMSLANVTDQVNSKYEAEHFHKLLEAMYSSLDEAVLLVNPENRLIEHCNLAAERMFGYTLDEIKGEETQMLHVSQEHFLEFGEAANASYERFGYYETEFQMKRKDGSIFDSEHFVTPIPDLDGKLIVYLSVVRDITNRKNAEEKLRKTLIELARSNKELEQYAYVASHDLQEPLRMVSSYTALLEKKYGNILDENAKEYMTFIIEGAKRMQLLIRDLLNYSRLTNMEKNFREADCQSIVNNTLLNLDFQIKESCAKINVEELPVITADPTLISQLFQNLISNAIKFRGSRNPEVLISCIERKEDWLFSVKDNGIGINPEYFDKVFVIFQRLHGREEYPGTGIGLTICKKIVEHHGGKIWVNSTEGYGSIFSFTISKS